MVFVLDRHKHPLMPCSPKRARLLLTRGRAVVHRLKPFVIRLKDRTKKRARCKASCSNSTLEVKRPGWPWLASKHPQMGRFITRSADERATGDGEEALT